MTLAAFAAVFFALLLVGNLSSVLGEIFPVLSIGLLIDIFATWLGNASILKFYCMKKGIN